jgi:hypothetical protein
MVVRSDTAEWTSGHYWRLGLKVLFLVKLVHQSRVNISLFVSIFSHDFYKPLPGKELPAMPQPIAANKFKQGGYRMLADTVYLVRSRVAYANYLKPCIERPETPPKPVVNSPIPSRSRFYRVQSTIQSDPLEEELD